MLLRKRGRTRSFVDSHFPTSSPQETPNQNIGYTDLTCEGGALHSRARRTPLREFNSPTEREVQASEHYLSGSRLLKLKEHREGGVRLVDSAHSRFTDDEEVDVSEPRELEVEVLRNEGDDGVFARLDMVITELIALLPRLDGSRVRHGSRGVWLV